MAELFSCRPADQRGAFSWPSCGRSRNRFAALRLLRRCQAVRCLVSLGLKLASQGAHDRACLEMRDLNIVSLSIWADLLRCWNLHLWIDDPPFCQHRKLETKSFYQETCPTDVENVPFPASPGQGGCFMPTDTHLVSNVCCFQQIPRNTSCFSLG